MAFETFRLIVWCWMALGFFTFVLLFFVKAPFGRHTRPGWGPTVDNRFAWFLMETTVLVSVWLTWAFSPLPMSAPILLMLGLFSLHYVHRAWVFPFQLRTQGKRMPVLIMLSAMAFNSVNGWSLGYHFGHFADFQSTWFLDLRFLLGVALFASGMFINIRSDYQLIGLREKGTGGYQIPRGGFFEWVSCPNHFGEILEWAGFALLTWSWPALAFACWTFANVAPRAVAHHKWYREKFADYPVKRKALIPGVW